MVAPPSLLDLCKQALVPLINRDARKWKALLNLPLDLLSCILVSLTPIVLQILHDEADFSRSRDDLSKGPEEVFESKNQVFKRSYAQMVQGSDRTQQSCLNAAWKYKLDKRWPSGLKQRYRNVLSTSEMDLLAISEDEAKVDWRQRFWEAHIQECLNEAAAQASAPYYDGPIGDISLPGSLLMQIGVEFIVDDNAALTSTLPARSSLKYNCRHFGQHARYLRLGGVLCTKELSSLLSHAKLQHVAYSRIVTAVQVEGLCLFLRQNKESLQAVEFHHCRFSQTGITEVCKSLILEEGISHQLHHFFVLSSSIAFQNDRISSGFIDFLRTGRYLRSVVLSDNQLDPLSASKILAALFEAAPRLSLLHISENELEGLFAREVSSAFSSIASSNLDQKMTCMPLKVLDLWSNKLNCSAVKEFLPCLKLMPFLEQINFSDNPIGDDGVRALVPYLQEIPLLELNVSACTISLTGASFLLEALSSLKRPLRCLKLAHNPLGRSIATPLAVFLKEGCVERLDIGDVGLGSTGCSELEEAVSEIPNLTHLIISKNRLGSAGATLLCKLIARSSSMKVIDSSCNLLDSECLKSISVELQLQSGAGGGNLELLDLRFNPAFQASEVFEEINRGRRPVVLLSNYSLSNPLSHFHDDDP